MNGKKFAVRLTWIRLRCPAREPANESYAGTLRRRDQQEEDCSHAMRGSLGRLPNMGEYVAL